MQYMHAAKYVINTIQYRRAEIITEVKNNKLQAQFCRSRAFKINAIESPSFDVNNGTTRVSDPL